MGAAVSSVCAWLVVGLTAAYLLWVIWFHWAERCPHCRGRSERVGPGTRERCRECGRTWDRGPGSWG